MSKIKAEDVVVGDIVLITDNSGHYNNTILLRVSELEKDTVRVVFSGVGVKIKRRKYEGTINNIQTISWWSMFLSDKTKIKIEKITDQIAMSECINAMSEIWETDD